MADRMSALGFKFYLDRVVIDSSPEPQRFATKAEGWQIDQALTLLPAIEAITKVGKGRYTGPRSFWRGMPRGHDKTSSIARMCNWVLAYTQRYITGVACAADKEQAALLTEFMEAEARLNPWFKRHLEFKRDRVVGRHGATLRILAADGYGSFGLKCDFHVCDELTHWANDSLWNAVSSGVNKRPGSVLIVITNAGQIGSWQWKAREAARTSPRFWNFYEAKGNLASWMMTERALDMQRVLPDGEVRRLHKNEWLDPAEDYGFVTRAEVQACEDRGTAMNLERREDGDAEVEYTAAIDYGPKKDRTVCVVGHRRDDDFVVDLMDVWQGREFPGKVVPIELVEKWIESVRANFPKVRFVIDEYQMESTIQKYSGSCRLERFEPRGGKTNFEMAVIVRDLIVNKRLHWYPRCGRIMVPDTDGRMKDSSLVDEFSELVIKPMAYGFRFDHTAGRHDDRAVAIGMATWKAMGGLRRRPFVMKECFF